ncbi:MAG: SMC-Scp complex subunit ScpB, partial [Parcubacteria group bacterium]|nr:SMC-Scp complex subunit ScpB [Parcubacteria group bacterium]
HKSAIESLLFVSEHPLSIKDFLKITDCERDEIEKILEGLAEDYKNRGGGVLIIKNQDKYQMVTSPQSSEVIQGFLKDETTGELTRPQLETLTTIAYRGPMSKAELEQIRGVNCSLVLRNLMMRGLVEMADQKNQEPKFLITLDFLKFLGIGSVKELPDYEKLREHETIKEILNRDEELT